MPRKIVRMPRTSAPDEAPTSAPTAEARIQSVARAKALLDAMAGGDWVSLRELAARTGLAKTTAFNLVSALVDVGLKSEGRVALREFSGPAGKAELKVGDVVEVYLERMED